MCKKCDPNYAHESLKLLKLYNRRSQKMVALNKISTNANNVTLDVANIDSIANDRYFPDLQKEKNWIAFNNNLNYLKKEVRKFTAALCKNIADKFLVAYS